MLENVLDTQNIVPGRQKNFLRRCKVVLYSLRAVFHSSWRPWNLVSKSQKSRKIYFSYVVSGLMRHLTLIFCRASRYDVGQCFRHSEYCSRASGKLLTAMSSWDSLLQLFETRFHGRHEERKTALRECKPTLRRRRKFFRHPGSMFWVSKTFSNIIRLRTEKTYGHATRQPTDIDKNTVAFDAKTAQTVFTSDIALNCHLSKKMIFFIKSQNLQK